MRILLVGGGSGGPVSPLLAVAEEIKELAPKAKFLLVGSKNGPETEMAEHSGMAFVAIPAGKLRRYFSWANFATPFFVLAGFVRALFILRAFRPDCIFGTGSFVQVPVVWAGWLLRIPSVIHQQDVLPSLANSLCQPIAKKITVSFEESQKNFFSDWFNASKAEKIVFTGNPFRQELKDWTKKKALASLKLKTDLPLLLVMGGGTGSRFLNDLVIDALPLLTKTVQVLHLVGQGRSKTGKSENYRAMEFSYDMGRLYAATDLVLCRAGLSTITELSNLGKMAIMVPMPKSHQEQNAFLMELMKAAIVVPQDQLSESLLVHLIKRLLFDADIQKQLQENVRQVMPKGAGKKIAQIILKLIVPNTLANKH